MSKNYFEKISKLNITAGYKEGKTILKDAFYTAPFKIMQPFYNDKDETRMQIMALSASAGIMEGDCQEINIAVEVNVNMEFLSQSYEKIHKMQEGNAGRRTTIKLDKAASFIYKLQPTIPFADSAFSSTTCVHLKDNTSRFIMCEILSCGRSAREERYLYRYYKSVVHIYCNNNLIYYNNTSFEPENMNMEGIGLMEGYSHLANIILCNQQIGEPYLKKIRSIIDNISGVTGGATVLESNDIAIGILGNNAQTLEFITEQIINGVILV